jgi:hypothetical protein
MIKVGQIREVLDEIHLYTYHELGMKVLTPGDRIIVMTGGPRVILVSYWGTILCTTPHILNQETKPIGGD